MAKKARPQPVSVVTPISISVRTVESMVRRLAQDTDNIAWSDHAMNRMIQRNISDVVAVDVLRKGAAVGDVEAGQNPGEWKIKMTHPVKGRREVGVVVLTVRNARLFVKTVEWEDLK